VSVRAILSQKAPAQKSFGEPIAVRGWIASVRAW
jgi:hypothetical protein